MPVPRSYAACAVVGHDRIFVVGGVSNGLVQYWDFVKPCCDKNDETQEEEETVPPVLSSSFAWKTQSHLVPPPVRNQVAMVAVGSCLVVVGAGQPTVERLDTNRTRVWNLPFERCSMVKGGHPIAVIGGSTNPLCATIPFLDKEKTQSSTL